MAKKRSTGSNATLMAAAKAAVTMLQDPRVQEQLIEASSTAADGLRNWKARRAEKDARSLAPAEAFPDTEASKPQRQPISRKLTARVGNQKMERRVDNLAANVDLLRSAVGPDAARALDEVDGVVNRLAVAVAMAANLPFGKRQMAHWEIDSVLDKLERALFSEALT